ncbi:MAG TPA: hypothetical protein VFJ16_08745 [Longimicrobium sp.]|nr:hypothetical protein [Longimicrobium sp.]
MVHSVPDAIAQALGLCEREKAGIQQGLIPEAVVAPDEEMQTVMLPAYEPQLPLSDDWGAGETFIGVCPDCKSQPRVRRRLHEVPRLRLQRVRVRNVAARPLTTM